ncbi:hypothetical protein [Micromonospora radicis]|uniref:hypothetical protein n=1 Tax=Micromonospora radicis TaxID=1894971 RepID=UPI0011C3E58B|nr:hypothetical protein [Micromonospora radicis]
MSLLVNLPYYLRHSPARPGWLCVVCNSNWPCALWRGEDGVREDEADVMERFLTSLLREALVDLADEQGQSAPVVVRRILWFKELSDADATAIERYIR